MSEERDAGIEIPIEYLTEGVPSGYATRLVIQHTEHEFILTFFEIKPPITLGSPEEQKKQLEQIESIVAKPVAQVTIAAGRMQNFIEALQGNFEKFEARFGKTRNADDR